MNIFTLCVILSMLISKVQSLDFSNKINFDIQDPNRFGRYTINYTRFELCDAIKTNNFARIELALTPDKSAAHLNFTFFGPTLLQEVKIVVYSTKNGKINNVLWTYKVKDPCKHYALGTRINKYLKATNCVISKGTYAWDMKVEDLSEPFFGPSFFYGEYLLKAQMLSKKGTILCMYAGLWFKKSE